MSFYDGFKDLISVAQKADNIELYRQLLDLSSQALDMQDEMARLKAENAELRKNKELEEDIENHVNPYVTRKSDTEDIKYCAACWGSKKVLIILQRMAQSGNNACHKYRCPLCNAYVYDI